MNSESRVLTTQTDEEAQPNRARSARARCGLDAASGEAPPLPRCDRARRLVRLGCVRNRRRRFEQRPKARGLEQAAPDPRLGELELREDRTRLRCPRRLTGAPLLRQPFA